MQSPDALLAAIAQSGNAVTQGWMRIFSSPPQMERNRALQAAYLEQQTKLWSALLAGRNESLVEDDDRRFAAREWRDNPYYNYLRQSYLLAAKYLEQMVDSAPLEAAEKERARFAARQWIDAMCPANFPATNPVALREALDTKGESLARGLANLVTDAQRGRISQTDESAFELGKNVATRRARWCSRTISSSSFSTARAASKWRSGRW